MEPASDRFDSVYPDMLQTGLGKLGLLDAPGELLALFAALEHFRRDLHDQKNTDDILRLSQQYIERLKLFRAAGGELEQIQLLLGHASVQTTERYLGTKQDLVHAVNDGIKLRVAV